MPTFTTTFDSERGAPGLGSFTVEFREGTQHILGPHAIRTNLVAGGPLENFKKDMLVVTSTDLGPNPSRADVLAASIFTGRIDRFRLPLRADSGRTWAMTGPSILAWIGSGDNPAVGVFGLADTSTAHTIGTLLLNLNGAQLNYLTYTIDASVPGTSLGIDLDGYDSVRDQINKAIIVKGVEYRCTTAGVLHFAARGDDSVFRETPTVMFTAHPTTNRDGDLWAFEIDGDVEYDYGPEANQIVSHDGTAVVDSADDTGDLRYGYGFDGTNDAEQDVAIGSEGVWQAADLDAQLANTFCRKNQMSLTVKAHSLADYLNAGDHVWVHAPDAFLYDDTESIDFAGEETHPIKLRTSALTCPVRRTHGVYVIHNSTAYGGANTVVRVNDYVAWPEDSETATATVEFDSPPGMRKLVRGRRWFRGNANA